MNNNNQKTAFRDKLYLSESSLAVVHRRTVVAGENQFIIDLFIISFLPSLLLNMTM